jgi:hypothetical protein
VRPGYASKVRCGAGVAGLCAGWSDARAGTADFAPAGRRIPTLNDYFSPLDYKYPFTYLERIRLPFKSYHYLLSFSLSLSSINELTKLEDLPFYPTKFKFLW